MSGNLGPEVTSDIIPAWTEAADKFLMKFGFRLRFIFNQGRRRRGRKYRGRFVAINAAVCIAVPAVIMFCLGQKFCQIAANVTPGLFLTREPTPDAPNLNRNRSTFFRTNAERLQFTKPSAPAAPTIGFYDPESISVAFTMRL